MEILATRFYCLCFVETMRWQCLACVCRLSTTQIQTSAVFVWQRKLSGWVVEAKDTIEPKSRRMNEALNKSGPGRQPATAQNCTAISALVRTGGACFTRASAYVEGNDALIGAFWRVTQSSRERTHLDDVMTTQSNSIIQCGIRVSNCDL